MGLGRSRMHLMDTSIYWLGAMRLICAWPAHAAKAHNKSNPDPVAITKSQGYRTRARDPTYKKGTCVDVVPGSQLQLACGS